TFGGRSGKGWTFCRPIPNWRSNGPEYCSVGAQALGEAAAGGSIAHLAGKRNLLVGRASGPVSGVLSPARRVLRRTRAQPGVSPGTARIAPARAGLATRAGTPGPAGFRTRNRELALG